MVTHYLGERKITESEFEVSRERTERKNKRDIFIDRERNTQR
jgi:hypothetical protein